MAHEYQPVEDAFRDGKISSSSVDDLNKYLLALANQPLQNDQIKHRDIIRGLTINHILLQRHIATLDAKNSKLQWIVVILTVAAVIGTASQTWFGYKADRRTEAESAAIAQKQQAQPQQQVIPYPLAPQVSDQPKKKQP